MAGISQLAGQVFERLDAADAKAFAVLLDESCASSFGNIGPVYGREAVQAGVEELFTVVARQSHEVLHEWIAGRDHIVEVKVTYTRRDGKVVSLPAVVIMTINDRALLSSYRVYIDQSPLFAA